MTTHNLEGRIALFLPDLSWGGAERIMVNLSDGLAQQGFPVDLVVFKAAYDMAPPTAPGVRLIDLKAGSALSSLLPLIRYLREEKPAALLSALDRANVVAILAKWLTRSPVRVVISIHNTMSVEQRNAPNFKAKIMPFIVRWTYRWADRIVAVSNGAADDVARALNIRRERIQVIYNPVVGPELMTAAEEPLDHPWFQPGQPPVLLTVGRMEPQKDHAALIHAFAEVRTERPVRLLILGDGSERSRMLRLAAELGCADDIDMPGFVQNPYPYMAKAAAFVLTSRWEGLPTVLIESLACGTPVISTDCPSGPREILAGGRYGDLVPMGDTAAMSRAILDVLSRGRVAPPPKSWVPFLISTAAAEYAKALLQR